MKLTSALKAGVLVATTASTVTFGLLASSTPAFANSKNPAWPSKITLGEVGAENSTTLLTSLAPVKKAMQKQLGVDLTVVTGTSYASMIEAQQAGKAQLIGYGPFSYYIAKNIEHLKISDVGILITAPHTTGTYHSEAVVNPKLNPQIKSLKDAKGTKVCFSDPSSTSGYLYPTYGLEQVGISPTKDVHGTFTGDDTSTALQASKGSCQIGFTNDINLPLAFQQKAINPANIKIIWKGPGIPGNPTAVSDSLPASFRTALQNFLVKDANSKWLTQHGYCSSVAACTKTMGGWGYASPKVANFNKIKQICDVTKSPSCTKP